MADRLREVLLGSRPSNGFPHRSTERIDDDIVSNQVGREILLGYAIQLRGDRQMHGMIADIQYLHNRCWGQQPLYAKIPADGVRVAANDDAMLTFERARKSRTSKFSSS
jgi:hypothetical protein